MTSVWVRQRQIRISIASLRNKMAVVHNDAKAELEKGHYKVARDLCQTLHDLGQKLFHKENEYEDVTGLIDTFERIDNRMNELEEQARKMGVEV